MGRFLRAAGAPGAWHNLRGGALASVLLAAAGCAQLAGIDETSGPDVPSGVSLSFERISVGATVVRSPLDITGQTATYVVADASAADGLVRVEALQTAPNAWTASAPALATGTPTVVFTLPEQPFPRMYALPSRDVLGAFGAYEHPNPVPPPSPAMITVTSTLPTPFNGTEAFELYSVGTWTRTTLPAPVLNATTLGPVAFDYNTVSATGHARPPERITLADVHAVLRYRGAPLTGVLEVAPFDQTGDDMMSGVMVAVPLDQTLDVAIAPATLPTRMMTPQPAMTSTSMGWLMTAAPGAAAAFTGGPVLISGTLTEASPTQLTATYGNPFVGKGWPAVVELRAQSSRPYTDPVTAAGIDLAGSMTSLVAASTLGAGATLDVPAGVPQTVSLDATPLTTDGLMIPRPVVAPVITFTTDGTADTLYTMVVFQLTPNATATALDRTVVISALGAEPSFTVPPELLVPGATYVIRAGAYSGGYPASATGDLTQRTLPVSQSFYEAGVFTVIP